MFFIRLAFIALVYYVIKFIFKLIARLKFSSNTKTHSNIKSKKNLINNDIKDAEFEDIE